jgi:hypothetical protein
MTASSSYFSASKFKKYLKDNTSVEIFNKLNDALLTEKAYIAGGSVLSCYSGLNFKTDDLDIYINQSNFNNFIIKLSKLYKFATDKYNGSAQRTDTSVLRKNHYLAPPYDNSFFKKNHILFRVRGISYTNIKIPAIDIIVIPDEINILDVLSNFDLTICEIWYNGRTVNGTNLADIQNKVGYLRKEYIDSLFKHLNTFIIKRIKKYRERGFKIEYDIPPSTTYTLSISKTKNVTNPTEWVIKKFLTIFSSDIVFNKIYLRTIGKSSNPNSLLHPYHSLIPKQNKDIKYLIFLNSFNKLDNFELLLENLSKYFLVKNPQKFVNKTLRYLYKYLQYRDNTIYKKYIEDLTDLRDTFENLSSFSPEFEFEGKFKCIEVMQKYIPTYDDTAIIDKVNKSEYEKLKIKNDNKCYDIILVDDTELDEYFKNDEILFVFNNKFFCYSKTYLNELVKNYLDNWFCECTGSFNRGTNNKQVSKFDLENIYVKIPLEINVFILYKYIIFILNNANSVYFLTFNKKITHSISFKNTNSNTANWVGANHCQEGSEINIYTITYCDYK